MSEILRWWVSINFKTRMISIAVLLMSIAMSSMVFAVVDNLRHELIYTNSRFCIDFNAMLARYIELFVKRYDVSELKIFFEQLYMSNSSIDGLALLSSQGDLLFSFPTKMSCIGQDSCTASNNYFLSYHIHSFFFNIPALSILLSRHTAFDFVSTLPHHNADWGFLQVGVSLKLGALYSVATAQAGSVIFFVAAWLMFVLGVVFNFYIMVEPVKKILTGLQNIASGNFSYQIDECIAGDTGNTIIGFNEMSKRLLSYEKHNVAQLISEKARLEALVAIMADGAILLDSELRLLFVNQVAIKVLGWSSKDLIGGIIFQYLPVHANEVLLPILNSMICLSCSGSQRLRAKEVDIDLHHGSKKTFRFLLSAILSYKIKALNGFVIIIQDITREAQLNGAKSQFIGNVSHELRTPLCNVRSFLETLIDYEHKLTNEQKSKFLLIAYSEVQRLDSLVNDVLDLSRLDSEYSHALCPVSLIDTVLYIMKASQMIALNKKIHICTELYSQADKALAHESSLCQVLSNLISNSLKFTHKRGKIIVRVYPVMGLNSDFMPSISKPDFLRIEIIDEGVGVDKMYQRQIFDRFMRIENNIHTLKGTGLGLSIVKNIVEKHGSSIQIYSEAGIGTSFWFDLPIVD